MASHLPLCDKHFCASHTRCLLGGTGPEVRMSARLNVTTVSHSPFYFEATSGPSKLNTSLNVLLMQTDGTNKSISVCAQRFYTDIILHKMLHV